MMSSTTIYCASKDVHIDINDEKKTDVDDHIGNEDENYYEDFDGEFDYYLKRLLHVKKHKNYQIMVDKGYGLSDYELLAIIYYCDDSSSCYSMKQYHRGLQQSIKLKHLYFHATNAIDKMHKCFHLKNDKQKEFKTLFHGLRCNQLDTFSQEQLFMKTITSFTSDWAVAKGTVSILLITTSFCLFCVFCLFCNNFVFLYSICKE